MIENFVTHTHIIQGEPALDDYLRADQSSFDNVINEAFDEYLCDMKDRGIDIRRLGIRLALPIDESVSTEDVAQRTRVVVTTDGIYEFTLKGCNASDGTFADVLTIAITEKGTKDFLIYNIYKFYKLIKDSGGTSYSAYLYETTFDYPLLYLMRSKVFFSIYHRNGDDAFKDKAEYYENKYLSKVKDIPASRYYYDIDDSGSIDAYEASKAILHKITLRP